MTRRIMLAVLALLALLLTLAVLPLGLAAARYERTAFRQDAEATGTALAAAAEEHLSDHHSPAEMLRLLRETRRHGDCAAVYDAAGRSIAATACAAPDAAENGRLVGAVLTAPSPRAAWRDGGLTVALPVTDEGRALGVAVLERGTGPLDARLDAVWGGLALAGGTGGVASAGLSVGLARWVGRPLRAMDGAARRLGEGALEARAPVGRGPREVRRLAATFNTMAARTQALVHGHRAVVADVSHQLRTPLAALRLRLDLLAADADDRTAAELAGAQEEIARLSRLVDGLLAVARAENAVPRPAVVPVDEVVAERVAAWRPVADERGVRITARAPAGLAGYLGAGDLEQVLDNLVANALDAAPAGGRVAIEAAAGRDTVRLRVADDGPGMSAAARESAFRRFGTTRPDGGGAGLGLAIVHRLVTANGGTVRLTPSPGGGLTALLELPSPPRGHGRPSPGAGTAARRGG